jgi:hypothetical protein
MQVSCMALQRLAKGEPEEVAEVAVEAEEQPMAMHEINLKELQSLVGGKKGKKKVDEVLQMKVDSNKEEIEKLASEFQVELAKPYFETSQNMVDKFSTAFVKLGFSVEELGTMRLKADLNGLVSQLCSKIADSIDAMDEESPDLSGRLKALMQEAATHHRYVVDVKLIKESKEKILELIRKLKVKDDALKSALDLSDSIYWLNDARRLLNDPTCDSNDIEELLSRKPKSVDRGITVAASGRACGRIKCQGHHGNFKRGRLGKGHSYNFNCIF